MNTRTTSLLAVAVCASFCWIPGFLAVAACAKVAVAKGKVSDSNRNQRKEFTYTITTVMRLLPPVRLRDMNDDYQEARLISHQGDCDVVQIVYYPINKNADNIAEDPNWKRDDAGMTEYLQPRPAANWDARMRKELLSELKNDGINPDVLTDKQLVQQVSTWLMKHSKYTTLFGIWDVYFPKGKPEVYPPLRAEFDAQKPSPSWSDQQMFGREVLGKEMFYNKVHGSCTSTAVLMATVFRALGIPTRIVVFIPAADPNNSRQVSMLLNAIHVHSIHSVVEEGLPSGGGSFDNHLFNEVFVDHHWVRLNYDNLGQNIVDRYYLGLQTHVYTCKDLSDIPLAQTWGMRYAGHAQAQPILSSVNPYMLLGASDHFGKYADIPNPPNPFIQSATVSGLYWPNDPVLSSQFNLASYHDDIFIGISEWLPDQDYHQLRTLFQNIGHDFVLRSSGLSDIKLSLSGNNMDSPDAHLQGFGARIDPADRKNLQSGTVYTLACVNQGKILWNTNGATIKTP